MKKLITVLFLFGILLNNYGQKISNLPAASSVSSADLFHIIQSGTGKNLQYVFLGNVISDSSDVLRAELPPLWRVDIADTADVLRIEIAAASTTDTAWTKIDTRVILKSINDSVGIGTNTPNTKFQVNGGMEARSLVLNNNASDENILIGNSAGASLTGGVGQFNIFIGEKAGTDATTLDNGVLLGFQAGKSLTAGGGTSPVFIGWNAGANTTDGSNILIGAAAGQSMTNGSFNIAIGPAAGFAATSSNNNTMIGFQAGNQLSSDNSTLIGFQSGKNLSQPGGTLIGHEAGEEATSSTGLTAVGFDAASTLTTSDFHTVVGFEALDAVQTSDGSTVMGYTAGTSATSAEGFSAYGYQAGLSITIGDRNSLFGYQSGVAIEDGQNNSLYGYIAGDDIVSGDENTIMGFAAGSGGDISGTVIIGNLVGLNNTASNVLMIDNTSDATPLIWGDFDADSVIINGDLRAIGYSGGANAWVDESDRRLKKNIKPITNGLDIIKGLQGVRFEWKDGRMAGQQVGFIAQDVQKVLPEVVSGIDPLGLQTARITAVLVEAIKEQQKQIESQQKQIDRLIKEVNRLK